MAEALRIAAWNANGLLQRIHRGVFFGDEKVDICLISETHLKRESYPKIKGYKIYHTIRPDKIGKGGSAVIIKENIKYYQEDNFETKQVQVTAVCVQTKPRNITMASVYCPPGYKLKKEEYVRLFQKLGNCFIMGGDYNAKNTFWGSRVDTPKGKELYEAIKEHRCEVKSTGKPTYWPTDRKKIPDLRLFCNEGSFI